ncbi:MAG: universal stress protein [Deltaproteobacteria bacterium]
MAIRKILCPIDFSEGSLHALRAATTLAAARDAELVILHVVAVPAVAYTSELVISGLAHEELLAAARPPLATAASDARAAGASRVTSRLETGPAAEVILEALADPSFDLCVIGTTGRTGLARILLGSIAEKIVRRAPCTTLSVPLGGTFALPAHVLCPVDFSPSSAHASELATDLVRPGGAITLLHVLELPAHYGGELPDEAAVHALAPHAACHLDDWAARLRPRCQDLRIHARVGNPGGQILGALDHDHSVDLLCIGSHGHTGVRRLLLGSLAEKIVRHARCPVLVARARI